MASAGRLGLRVTIPEQSRSLEACYWRLVINNLPNGVQLDDLKASDRKSRAGDYGLSRRDKRLRRSQQRAQGVGNVVSN